MEKSQQYTFINNLNSFTISLVKGAHLIKEIETIHNIGPHAKDFYRKTVLSSMQMVNFLKPQESLGFYIDSSDPYYRFKVEMSFEGTMRTLLLPEEFSDFPTDFTGNCRIHKTIVGKSPYTSVLQFKDENLEEIINQVMEQSYQTHSTILMASDHESSLMITLLPPSNVDSKIEELDPLDLPKIKAKYGEFFKEILNNDFSEEKIIQKCTDSDFVYLGSKQMSFKCPCSRERMIENLFTLTPEDRKHIFEENNPIEIRCDYCNTLYQIKEEEVDLPVQ